MIFHTFYIIAYVTVNPHIDFIRSCLEIFNEVAAMLIMYHFVGWTGLIEDLQMQFDTGYLFITLILTTLFVNLYVIVQRTIEDWQHKRNVDLNRLRVL